MYVIMCLKAKTEGKRYVSLSYYPNNVESLDKATKFLDLLDVETFAKSRKGDLDTGDGWIMCAIEEIVTKPVKNLIGVGNWLDKI